MKGSRRLARISVAFASVLLLFGVLGGEWKLLLEFAGATIFLAALSLAFIWFRGNGSRPKPPAHVKPAVPIDIRSFHTKVAGVTHANPDGVDRQSIISMCEVGEELLLMREPDNKYDANAIKVCRASGEQLGYIARDVAARMAGEIDRGKQFSVFISELTGGTESKPTCGVNLEVYVHPSV